MIARVLAFFALAVGLLVLLVSCGMDLTVDAGAGGRVMNLSLIARQASMERWGFGLLVVGLLLWIAGRRAPNESSKVDAHRFRTWLGGDSSTPQNETASQADERRRRDRSFYDNA